MRIKFELGTMGVTWGKDQEYHADCFLKPYWGVFLKTPGFKTWWKMPFLDLLRIHIHDPERARISLRDDLKPFTIVPTKWGTDAELVSYPFVDGAQLMVMARKIPGDPTSMVELDVERLNLVEIVTSQLT